MPMRWRGPPKNPWDPLSGYYPVKNGRWVSIHCNFPNHRNAAMKVLGNAADRAAAEEASRGWDGLALEGQTPVPANPADYRV